MHLKTFIGHDQFMYGKKTVVLKGSRFETWANHSCIFYYIYIYVLICFSGGSCDVTFFYKTIPFLGFLRKSSLKMTTCCGCRPKILPRLLHLCAISPRMIERETLNFGNYHLLGAILQGSLNKSPICWRDET